MELFDAAGKSALVTGASGGIGRAVVQLFRDAGANVAAVDITPPEETGDSGTRSIQADCTDETAVRNAVAATVDRFQRIDYLVHAVGVVGPGKFMDIDLAHWRRILDLNLTSAFLACQAIYPHLKATKGSAVVA